ncbi:MAG: riboflavin synthase subunit alpha [Micavibrio sp.]|nr:MAG: riboflavin synthase subunit alpha [Micavibrio sp.]
MFTGLVQTIGTVRSIENRGEDLRLEIETELDLNNVSIGASIACSGVCLTVTTKAKNSFWTDVSSETLRKTMIKNWAVGTKVNIEPSLHLGDEIGGHFVFGHVDGVAQIMSIKDEGKSHVVHIQVPEELSQYIAPKGSVSLDGISLTVNEVENDIFSVNIIPHTWEKTTLGLKNTGDVLNIEIDMLARYVARMLNREAA